VVCLCVWYECVCECVCGVWSVCDVCVCVVWYLCVCVCVCMHTQHANVHMPTLTVISMPV